MSDGAWKEHQPYRVGELALPAEEMRQAGYRAVDAIVERLRGVADRAPLARGDREPLPEQPTPLREVLDRAAEQVPSLGCASATSGASRSFPPPAPTRRS